MLSLIEKIIFLKGNQLFHDIDISDLIHIARITDEFELPGNSVLIKENETGDELFIIIEGEVEVIAGGRVIDVFGSGSCIGELAIIDREPRSATVKTKKRTRMLSLHRRDFLMTLKENPVIAINVMQVIANRLRKSL